MRLVSVYIPTKNRLDLLRRAVQSVLGQSYTNFELIIVDDGSTDGTTDFLCLLAKQDGRVRHIRNDISVGAPNARNTAIAAAQGEFLTGLDDDDEFAPNRLETFIWFWQQLESMRLEPSCLYSAEVFIGVDGRVTTRQKPGMGGIENLLDGNSIGNQIFAPARNFKTVGNYDSDLLMWQDLDLLYRFFSILGPGRLVDMPTYQFDASPRNDRISIRGQNNLRKTVSHIIKKHNIVAPRVRQRLHLHIFGWHYNLRPKISDFFVMIYPSLWLHGIRHLLKVYFYRLRNPD